MNWTTSYCKEEFWGFNRKNPLKLVISQKHHHHLIKTIGVPKALFDIFKEHRFRVGPTYLRYCKFSCLLTDLDYIDAIWTRSGWWIGSLCSWNSYMYLIVFKSVLWRQWKNWHECCFELMIQYRAPIWIRYSKNLDE